MYQSSKGVYVTKDGMFMIVKSDFTKRCTWSWWVKGDFAWIDKDKREYRTKAQAERCVEVAMESIHYEYELWEG